MTARLAVAVVGGGFTGAAVAVHLARASSLPLDIVVIEPRPRLGEGLAYGSASPEHRINVPSDRMEVFRDEPQHFTRWLERSGRFAADPEALTAEGHHYSSRQDFGHYMAALVDETNGVARASTTAPASTITHHRAAVTALSREGAAGSAQAGPRAAFRIDLDDGTQQRFAAVILTASHAAPVFPWPMPASSADRVLRDPWQPGALDGVPPEGDVVIAGTGLTMCDRVVSLRQRGHRGQILAISRRALLPRVHTGFDDGFQLLVDEAAPRTARSLLRRVRERVRVAEAEGLGWRAALDATRRVLPALWQGLPEPERARALRCLRPWWDVHRFRMAPQVAALIDEGRADGWLTLAAGRILQIEAAADSALIVLARPRRELQRTPCALFINCVGPDSDLRRSANPLFRSLIDGGLARVDSLRLGLDADADGCVRDAGGSPDSLLRVAGPLARAGVGEVTGVTEASAHARRVAESLALALAAGAAG